jgi:Zn-dependent protease with chaperone function
MSSIDFSDRGVGEEMHAKLMDAFGHESEAWAIERVGRVTQKLNAVRARCPTAGACGHALTAEILWLGEMNAFATPGQYVYITRALLQRFGEDDPVAFILAHEMAHHDLGHVRLLLPYLQRFGTPTASILGALIQRGAHLLYGKERETASDKYALDLCVAADYKYNGFKEAFQILENESLDWRDIVGVFGSEKSEKACGTHPALRTRTGVLERYFQREYLGRR